MRRPLFLVTIEMYSIWCSICIVFFGAIINISYIVNFWALISTTSYFSTSS